MIVYRPFNDVSKTTYLVMYLTAALRLKMTMTRMSPAVQRPIHTRAGMKSQPLSLETVQPWQPISVRSNATTIATVSHRSNGTAKTDYRT